MFGPRAESSLPSPAGTGCAAGSSDACSRKGLARREKPRSPLLCNLSKRDARWWWCGRDVTVVSLSVPVHEHAPNSGERTPGSQTPGVPVTPEPSMTKTSSSSRAHLALNVRMDGSAKNGVTPSHRHKRKLSTGTVGTLSVNCKCRTLAVFCTVTTNTCRCTKTGMSTSSSKNWTRRRPAQQGHRPPCQRTATAHCRCTKNGDVNNLEELHLEREGLHCGYLSQRHDWNVRHSDELDLRHLQVLVRHGLQELELYDHRDVHNGDNENRSIALYGIWGSLGRGSPHPKEADTRRHILRATTPEGVSPIIGPGTLPLQPPG